MSGSVYSVGSPPVNRSARQTRRPAGVFPARLLRSTAFPMTVNSAFDGPI